MKKLVLLTLIAMVPFLTMAQKRTKKTKETKTETTNNSSDAKVNFMIIKGVEVDMSQEGMDDIEKESADVSLDNLMKKHVKPVSKIYFSYDVGRYSDESSELLVASQEFRSMSQAVNKAAEYGWEFINSTIVVDGNVIIHYFYMKR